MDIFPPENEFISAKARRPFFRKIGKDIGPKPIDPVELYKKISRDSSYSFLLESGKGSQQISRYSFLGANPYLVFQSTGDMITLIRPEPGGRDKVERLCGDPISRLRDILTQIHVPRDKRLPAFSSGCVGLFSYDLVHQFENLPRNASNDLAIPEIFLIFVETTVVIDHICPDDSMIIFSPRDWDIMSRREIYSTAKMNIERILTLLNTPLDEKDSKPDVKAECDSLRVHKEISKDQYMSMVRKCKEYIAAGDIFQANLSQRFRVTNLDPLKAYVTLRAINPSPFAAFLDFGNLKIASSSPERLVKLHDGTVETRPIAGTRPRGTGSDKKMSDELISHPKERAEHIMLVDLERNDMGRVCEFGSIKVDELMILEKYSHVIHIVSNITGRLKDGKDCFDLLSAVFPGGTITGVPKVRCMEIIDELEPVSRGAYTGSIGYISATGDMDLNILIRTFVFKDADAYIQVGAGIVADSDPEMEYYETVQKGKALLEAVAKIQTSHTK